MFRRVQFANKFFDLFEDFRQHMRPTHSRSRVKIAILDTGIDSDQLGLQLRRDAIMQERETAAPSCNGDPIKAMRSFIEPRGDVKDSCGHGTLIVEILLRLAPEADLNIAKISKNLSVDKVDQITEVSSHVERWSPGTTAWTLDAAASQSECLTPRQYNLSPRLTGLLGYRMGARTRLRYYQHVFRHESVVPFRSESLECPERHPQCRRGSQDHARGRFELWRHRSADVSGERPQSHLCSRLGRQRQ